jgi:hypothetical protein
MILTSQMKFDLGQLVITPAALEAVPADDICNAINRHVCGDFGDLDADDRRENELALRAGLRLLSVYHATNGTKFWLITEADRRLTTILLPSDY